MSINTDGLGSLIKTYTKYGWHLRRLVITGAAEAETLSVHGVPIADGVVDAAWFSRPQQAGPIAWEIRYIGPSRYALVEHLDENSPDFELKLQEAERRLADAVAARGNA